MASLKSLADGLAILMKYAKDGAGSVAAEHDEIFAGGEDDSTQPKNMTGEDVKQLEKLGWSWDDGLDSWRTFA